MFHEGVYDGLRVEAVAPTRLYEDAFLKAEWQQRGFVDVLSGGDESLFISTLRLSRDRKKWPKLKVRESMTCASTQKNLLEASPELAMPYGLPAIAVHDQQQLSTWVRNGAKGHDVSLGLQSLTPTQVELVRSWEEFFNGSDLKSKLVARYLFEHFFMAHFYLEEKNSNFLKLVRSSTSCSKGIVPLATRRPTDDPVLKKWNYCFYTDPATVVHKNHMPYELSAAKLTWLKKNFFSEKWKIEKLPSYSAQVAANPLKAYLDIPVLARYRFLLENSYYQVMTFIKGPVCNGSLAVNSIQEQFYVFFVSPEKDLMVRSPSFAKLAADETLLPGSFGENPDVKRLGKDYIEIIKNRAAYRKNLAHQLEKNYPDGLDLDFIWDGSWEQNKTNPNPVLTVFRHDDNAKVVRGAVGDIPKTAFLLDYSTFERLVYNLATNFDVYDNVAHQVLSRLYMDILRMDAEDNFLQMLQTSSRQKTKELWYQGLSTRLKLDVLGENAFAPIASRVKLTAGADQKLELIQKILFSHLKPGVRPKQDGINWKRLQDAKIEGHVQTQLRKLASVTQGEKGFPTYFPEVSLLFVKTGESHQIFSILHHREHENVAWIIGEDARRKPAEDTLSIVPGILGAYPNQFLFVEEQNLAEMVEKVLTINTEEQFKEFLKSYGIHRREDRIWHYYDLANAYFTQVDPVEGGVLDLSRYAMD